jgi:hypothetical protein
VVSVSQSEAGDGAFNVIPAKAVLCGTIQALSNESLCNYERVYFVLQGVPPKLMGVNWQNLLLAKIIFP